MPNTLINVSNRLPVTVEEDRVTKSSGGLVAALEGLPEGQYKTKWIGWPGAAFPEESRRQEIARKLAEEHGCVPVFLSEEEATAFYEGFSNSSIWPLLHYLPNYLRYEPAWWQHYQNVNRTFAEKVLETVQEGDLVWVHDYQLMLLPAMLRAAAPNLRIGFFLHTAFPAYEIFRCHPRRRELVAGMLGANRIGFHAFGYLRHFCSTVQRLLGIETELTHIPSEGHITALGIYPIGINAPKFEQTLDSEEFHQRTGVPMGALCTPYTTRTCPASAPKSWTKRFEAPSATAACSTNSSVVDTRTESFTSFLGLSKSRLLQNRAREFNYSRAILNLNKALRDRILN